MDNFYLEMPQHLEIHKTFVTPSHGQSIYSYLSELSFLRICDLPASPHLHSPKEEVMGAALPSPISISHQHPISIPSQKIILFQRGILLCGPLACMAHPKCTLSYRKCTFQQLLCGKFFSMNECKESIQKAEQDFCLQLQLQKRCLTKPGCCIL